MKKIISLVLMILISCISIPGMALDIQAETGVTVIPKGFIYEISSNGKYQLAEDYEGYIRIGSGVTEVTVTDEVYGGTNANTCIMVASGRTSALQLTIKDIDITARSGNAGIDFSLAGDYSHMLLISGTCSIGAIADSDAGVQVPYGVQLTIDKAEENSELSAAGGYGAAGIGGGRGLYATAGSIIIDGGRIAATGGNQAAGIGGGEEGNGGIVTINGGLVTATSGWGGAGIGGGIRGSGGNISIMGGEIVAAASGGAYVGSGIGGGSGGNGGIISIGGGIVEATGGKGAAGIGGGAYGSGGIITIDGGSIEAKTSLDSIYSGAAGIGGGYSGTSGAITINGGEITATGSGFGTGIGSGGWVPAGETPGIITINDGIINATGYGGGAGIGSGLRSSVGDIIITGGNITANANAMQGFGAGGAGIGSGSESEGGNISIGGGTINAISSSMGAGIGGGNNGSGGVINISGGNVTATSNLWGAGIGGGQYGSGGTITISGGVVTATGKFAGAGIGGGYNGNGGNISIENGTVTACGGAAGIGGGQDGDGGTIIISGGSVEANGGYSENGSYSGYGTTEGGAGIGGGQNGSGGTITINAGTVTATGGRSAAGIGGGASGSGGNIIMDDSAVVIAIGYLSWTGDNADNIGKGSGGTDSGSLKDSSGNDLSYLSFDTNGVSGARIDLSGFEGISGVYMTNDQGYFSILVPDTESRSFSYIVSKAGWAAVNGNGDITSSNCSVVLELLQDTEAPAIGYFIPFTESKGFISCNGFGIYGALYMVPKTDTGYNSKASLDGAAVKKSISLLENNKKLVIDASDLNSGVYQFYLVDSAENLSSPLNIALPFELNSSSGSNGSGGNSSGGGSISRILKTPSLKPGTSIAVVEFSAAALDNAFRTTAANIDGNKRIELDIPRTEGAEGYEINLPAGILAGAAGKEIKLKTEYAEVILPSNMLTPVMAGAANTAALTISRVDASKLSAEVRSQIGGRPVIELALKLDGRIIPWSNPNAPVTVAIPYLPTAEELISPENITIWYIDGNGNIVAVPTGRYDPATGMVRFIGTHFSYYAVAYVKKAFSDLGGHAWANKQIEVLTARAIMNGRTDTEFEPSRTITRAEYIGALIRTLGVTASAGANFEDVKEDNIYYKEIAAAKKLGITNGMENDCFKPEAAITRQDMMVLTERALNSLKGLDIKGSVSDLEPFTDRAQLKAYAGESVAALVKEGLVAGSNGELHPGEYSTRAEAAVFLHRIYSKYYQ